VEKIFGPKNEEARNGRYFKWDIFMICTDQIWLFWYVKLRRLQWARHVTQVGRQNIQNLEGMDLRNTQFMRMGGGWNWLRITLLLAVVKLWILLPENMLVGQLVDCIVV
jgi:hypothetical protein